MASPGPCALLLALACACLSGTALGQSLLPSAQPRGSLGFAIMRADSIVAAAVDSGRMPGAVMVVTHRGSVIHERAFGYAQLYDREMRRLADPRPMTTTTVFDMASVTKVMATTLAVMVLVDRGAIDLDWPVYRYLPDFRGASLDSITVRHLLTHSSGLAQWQPLYYAARSPAEAYQAILRMPLQWGVGSGRHYSDLGFMLLGTIVERVGRKRLDDFVHQEIHAPLGLRTTLFRPLVHGVPEIAATSHGNPYERKMVHDTAFGYRYRGDPASWSGWREHTLVGEVNDGNAWYAFGGVAGHAGLFSTAREAAAVVQLLMNGGTLNGRTHLSAAVIDTFTRRGSFDNGLGWAVPRNAPEGSFNHTGFTGTFVMGVPAYDLGIVLLTNRQNLGVDTAGNYPSVAGLQNAVVNAILAGASPR